MCDEELTLDNPRAGELLGQLMPPLHDAFLYYLILGIIEGDIKWCHLLRLHRTLPRDTATMPPRDTRQTVLLLMLDGMLHRNFRRRRYFGVVRTTLFAHLYERPPAKLKKEVECVMQRFASERHPAIRAFLPVPISPE